MINNNSYNQTNKKIIKYTSRKKTSHHLDEAPDEIKLDHQSQEMNEKYEHTTKKVYHMINNNPDTTVYSKRYEYKKTKE